MQEILELLRNVPLGGISFAGLVALAIVLIFRGDIVPKSTVERNNLLFDRIISSKDYEINLLKEAYKLSEEARRTNAEADKELLELGRTTVRILKSIHQKANEVTS